MDKDKNNQEPRRKMMPRRMPPVILIILVSVVAFVLGALLFGGDTPSDNSMADREHGSEKTSAPTMWTCSMHPQIKLPKPGKCPICFMDLIPVDQGTGEETGMRQLRMSETAKKLAQIESTPVIRAFAEREVRLVGKLDYDETKLAYVAAWIPGRLDRLYADYTGTRIKKGEAMVYIYSPELMATQEELIQALKTLEALDKSKSKVLRSTAQATVDAAHDKLRLYGLSDEQIREFKSTQKVSDHLTIEAPISGVVVKKDAVEGMYVSTGTKIYTVADLSKLWVLFEAYESDLPWIRYAQSVDFTTPSFPGEKFEAIISFIHPVVDPRTRTVKIRAVVKNEDERLKPDMFVSAVILSRLDHQGKVVNENLAGKWIGPMHPEIVKNAPGKCDICGMDLVSAESLGYASKSVSVDKAPLLIPATAPLITGKRAVVYAEMENDEGPLFEGREIELGPRAGDFYIVKSGLQEGELVVTNGAFKIDSELQLQAKPSMMLPNGGAMPPGHNHTEKTVVKIEADNVTYKAGTAARLTDCEEAQDALIPVFEDYFDVQMALANDDFDEVTAAFEKLRSNIQSVDMGLFKDEAHVRWMKISSQLANSANKGVKATKIDESRDAFYHLSNAVIELHDTFGHAEERSYFLTFCPMARDSKGAYWLQTVDTVYNSFYGASMLRCGEIKQELQSSIGKSE